MMANDFFFLLCFILHKFGFSVFSYISAKYYIFEYQIKACVKYKCYFTIFFNKNDVSVVTIFIGSKYYSV